MATADTKDKHKKKKKEKKKKERAKGGRSGADELLGVGVAAVALAAGAGSATLRLLHERRAESDKTASGAIRAGHFRGREILPVRPDPDDPPTGIKGKLHALGRRFAPFGRALEVQQRYSQLHGNNLAASVTFQAFLSLFPLLIITVAAVGWVAGSGEDVAGRVIGELGLTGEAATAVDQAVIEASQSKRAATVIGFVTLVWSGLGLVNALQYAFDQVWQVQERGLKDKAVGMLWLLGAALLFVAAAAITTVVQWLPGFLAPLGLLVALVANLALWVWTSKILPNTRVPWRAVLPGAIFAAIGLEVLKVLGAIYVPRAVASSSQLYGALGVVFAILAWLFFFGRLIVYSAVINVVSWERKAGTVKVVTEVPNQPGATRGEQVTRMGRLKDAG